MDWCRLWHEMPTDPKWRAVARRSKQRIGDVIAVMTFLMVNASANEEERGRLLNWSSEDVAAALDLETADVEAIRAAMEGKVITDDCLTGWNKRQPKREDDSAARTRAWRKRKVTHGDADVTHGDAPDGDTDGDTEITVDERAWPITMAHILQRFPGSDLGPEVIRNALVGMGDIRDEELPRELDRIEIRGQRSAAFWRKRITAHLKAAAAEIRSRRPREYNCKLCGDTERVMRADADQLPIELLESNHESLYVPCPACQPAPLPRIPPGAAEQLKPKLQIVGRS